MPAAKPPEFRRRAVELARPATQAARRQGLRQPAGPPRSPLPPLSSITSKDDMITDLGQSLLEWLTDAAA